MVEYFASLKRLSGNDKCADCEKPGKSILDRKTERANVDHGANSFCQPGSELEARFIMINR